MCGKVGRFSRPAKVKPNPRIERESMKLVRSTKLTMIATACLSLGLYVAAHGQDTSRGGHGRNPTPGMTPSSTPLGHHYGWDRGRHNPHHSPTPTPTPASTA